MRKEIFKKSISGMVNVLDISILQELIFFDWQDKTIDDVKGMIEKKKLIFIKGKIE